MIKVAIFVVFSYLKIN